MNLQTWKKQILQYKMFRSIKDMEYLFCAINLGTNQKYCNFIESHKIFDVQVCSENNIKYGGQQAIIFHSQSTPGVLKTISIISNKHTHAKIVNIEKYINKKRSFVGPNFDDLPKGSINFFYVFSKEKIYCVNSDGLFGRKAAEKYMKSLSLKNYYVRCMGKAKETTKKIDEMIDKNKKQIIKLKLSIRGGLSLDDDSTQIFV